MNNYMLDVRGLRCPLPVLKLRRFMKNVPVGERVVVYTTDPQARAEFNEFCALSGDQFLQWQSEGGNYFCALLLKK